MATYLFQVAYTSSALSAVIAHPQDRSEAVRKPIEKLGGKIVGLWLAFGDYDTVGIIEMPDNVSAAAFAVAVAAGGSVKAQKTTPLLSIEDGMAAMKKAATCGYKPIGAK
ncbi:MAG TPA: GYD domain-containing protein [Terracidiphilus sp.]|nr:GYD domain-containing protein [Terracidiphilus sp.]